MRFLTCVGLLGLGAKFMSGWLKRATSKTQFTVMKVGWKEGEMQDKERGGKFAMTSKPDQI